MAKPELASYYQEFSKPQEQCGVTAIFSKIGEDVSHLDPLLQNELQHRGYDSAGVATWDRKNKDLRLYTGFGRVAEVFPDDFDFGKHQLISDRAIGHNRYGTSGGSNKDDKRGVHPVTARWGGRKWAISYNGNLPDVVRKHLKSKIPVGMEESMFDTQDIVNAIASAEGDTLEDQIKNGMEGVDLAYSLTLLTDDGRVFGLRGPSGTWPLYYGETDDKIIFSSESRVWGKDNIVWKEVKPGELVEATREGVVKTQIFNETSQLYRCSLHDTYGARGDSLMSENITYGEFRKELGRQLAKEHPLDVDLIVGVPETGLVMAEGYAEEVGGKSSFLIERNKMNGENSNGRSFIAKNLEETSLIVSKKYKIPDPEQANGKKVLLIDDSLIRGKTMGGDPKKGLKGVIGLVRDAGAEEVHLAVTLPKFVEGCDMGYFIRKDQLVAYVKNDQGKYQELSEQEISNVIGADSVHFLSADGVKRAYEKVFGKKDVACMSCMGGEHPLLSIARSMKNKEEVIYSA